ncbi:MAG: phospholipid carrier-dependent glycosyltransferase, partial [Chloroflexota bacterium]
MSGYTLPHIRRNLALTAILVAFIGLGLAYSVINPLHEATDELRHYRFVRHLILYRRLPVQGQEECRSQSHHAPLFYVLGAVATGWIETGRDLCYEPPANPFWAYRYWEVGRDNKNQYLHGPDEEFPWRGEALAAHLLRAMNVLVGAGVVWLTWAAGRALWPQRPALALGATAFVAFNPMFLYLAGAINNDVLAAFSGAAVTLACLHLLRDPQGIRPRWGVWLGGLLGLALLSKFSLAAVILPIEVAMTWVAWPKRQWRAWLSANTLVVVIAAALAGWWFVRNQLLYDEPTGFQMVTELWGVRDPADSVGLAISELPYFWSSLWGRFGFGQIPLPQAIYTGLFGLTIVGGLGLLLDFGFWILDFGLGRRHLPSVRRPPSTVSTLLFLLLDVLVFFGVVFSYMLVSPAGALGRFFFPALPAFA